MMTRRFIRISVGALTVFAAYASLASGQIIFDVQVQAQDGQVVIGVATTDESTGGISDITLSYDPSVRVFTEVLGTNFGSSNPGFNVVPTGSSVLQQSSGGASIVGLGEGAELFVDFVPTTIDGVTSNFFYWDGADSNGDEEITEEDFSFNAPTTGQTFGIATQTGFVSVAGTDEFVEGGRIDTTSIFEPVTNLPGGRLHRHHPLGILNSVGFPSSSQPDGIYVTALQARVEGLESSDPFFWVFESRNFAETSGERGDLARFVAEYIDENYDEIVGLVAPFPPGDFNLDEAVNAADFVVFRDGAAAPGAGLEVFDEFAANFGAEASQAGAAVTSLAVPEPATGFGLAWIVSVAMARRRR